MKKQAAIFLFLILASVASAQDSIVIVFADGSKQVIPLSQAASSIKSIHFNSAIQNSAPRKQAASWGEWKTTFGIAKFYKQGNRLTARFKDGLIDGKLSKDGKSFEGIWKKGRASGKLFFQINARSLNGKYFSQGKQLFFRGNKFR